MALDFVATAAFEKDYDNALAYITYQLGSPHAALNLMDAMDVSIERITEFPEINAVSQKPTLQRLGYREEIIGGYVMLYRIEENAIVAKRLFHMTQDYESYV